ncbi:MULTISPECIES: alkaline shock response membrane anchor protein AmaP [unclassified Paenibacillus]|uniref:alkaline shock response membrane anchor protein AmaP n=1 Tax=unclassified Paenibacillus TaxID=185978 RepID=UPI001AE60F35|nr:putative alkaline shock family protein YloU [Paenibacillus sp. PvP091]MBP1169480.1 putative alkaline shock family protein YloU [Paenibacillus sp. PvR098]MBP2440508.1 putative alkaline shock family protein YloU [Paenibacillus sp. PvP052]
MVKVLDRLLLLLFSCAILIASIVLLFSAFGLISTDAAENFVHDVYYDLDTAVIFISITFAVALISIRFLYLAVRRGKSDVPSIDQRTEFGDIRISLDTVENLSLKAAGRTRGVKDLRSRVKVNQSGLEIVIRAIVDGESSIPALTEEIQGHVKNHIEDITGIPVAHVTVFIANIQQSSPTFKSRVE